MTAAVIVVVWWAGGLQNVYNVCNSRLKPMTEGGAVKGTHTLSYGCILYIYMYKYTYKKPPSPPARRIFFFAIPPPLHTPSLFLSSSLSDDLEIAGSPKRKNPKSRCPNTHTHTHTHTYTHTHAYIMYTHTHTLTRWWRRTWGCSGGEFKVKKSPEGAEEPESWLDL